MNRIALRIMTIAAATVLSATAIAASPQPTFYASQLEARWNLAEPDPSSEAGLDTMRSIAARTGPMWRLDLQQALAREARTLHQCYAGQVSAEGVGTKIDIRVVVGRTGVVVFSDAKGVVAERSRVGSCIRMAMLDAALPERREGGLVEVSFSITVREALSRTTPPKQPAVATVGSAL